MSAYIFKLTFKVVTLSSPIEQMLRALLVPYIELKVMLVQITHSTIQNSPPELYARPSRGARRMPEGF